MKNNTDRYGYKFILLRSNNKYKLNLIHRLLAITFIKNTRKDRNQINHINGRKGDNRLCNLEWATGKENYNNFLKNNKKENPSSKLKIEDVRFIRKNIGKIKNKDLAIIFNVCASDISDIKRNKIWKNKF